MATLYDKNYELPKGCYGLTKPTYIVVTARIRAYPEFKRKIARIDDKSEIHLTEDDILAKNCMQAFVDAIEAGTAWISEEYREPIWKYAIKHYEHGVTWEDIAEEYHYSSSHLRLQYVKFVYGVAFELGEII